MSTPTESAKERINLRLNARAKNLLERAASFEGKTLSNFILSTALAHAEETVHEHEIMTLNARDSVAFFNALAKPVRFNAKLTAAIAKHGKHVIAK